MKLVVLDTPQSDRELASWMEQVLVSENLPQWLAELAAVRKLEGANDRQQNASEVLAERLTQIVDYGLMCLSREQMRLLLESPEQLLQLQRELFLNESAYWTNALNRQTDASDIERERTNIALHLGPEAVVLARKRRDNLQASQIRRLSPTTISVCVGVLSILLISGYLLFRSWQHQRSVNGDWNWTAQVTSTHVSTSKDYFAILAQEAEDWYRVRPSNIDQLRTRVSKLKSNLEDVSATNQKFVESSDQKWLKQSAKEWIEKIDAISKLDDFSSAIDAADALCLHIIDEFHRRSDSFNR